MWKADLSGNKSPVLGAGGRSLLAPSYLSGEARASEVQAGPGEGARRGAGVWPGMKNACFLRRGRCEVGGAGFSARDFWQLRTLARLQARGSEGFGRKPAPPKRAMVSTRGGGGRGGPRRTGRDGWGPAGAPQVHEATGDRGRAGVFCVEQPQNGGEQRPRSLPQEGRRK